MGFDANGDFIPPTREELSGHLGLLRTDLDNLLGQGNYEIVYDKIAKRVVVNEKNMVLEPNTRAKLERIESQLQDCKEVL